MPISELTLLLFVHISPKPTHQWIGKPIGVYLSTVHHLHLTAGLLDTFSAQETLRLAQVLQGIKRYQACTTLPTIHLPITIQIMQIMRRPTLQYLRFATMTVPIAAEAISH